MNSTSEEPRDDGHVLLGVFGYLVQGPIIGFSNLCIGLSINRYSALHKLNRYVLLMGLAFADATNMMAYTTAGVYRLWVIYNDRLDQTVTPVECLLKPQTFLWMVGFPFAALMLVIVSGDRLFLISFPSTYFLSLPSPRYARCLVYGSLSLSVTMAVVGAAAAFSAPSVASESALCFLPLASNAPGVLNQVFVYYYQRVSYLAFVSVIIFAAVPIVNKIRSQQVTDGQQEAQNEASQRRMTKTISVSCLCTLLLFCVPHRLGYMAFDAEYFYLARLLFLFSMCNPLANCFIYQLRHSEMRVALKGLFSRKLLPDNLALWPTTDTNQPQIVVDQLQKQEDKKGSRAFANRPKDIQVNGSHVKKPQPLNVEDLENK